MTVMARLAREALVGARLRRVIGLRGGEVLLEFDLPVTEENQGTFATWLLSAHPTLFRVHPWLEPIPPRNHPTHLVEVASHHIGGAKVIDVEVTRFERIITFQLRRRDYSGEEMSYRLIAELMGKHSNIILVDSADTILASYKPVHSYQSRAREIRAGKKYVPPPMQDRIVPRDFTPAEWKDFLDSADPMIPIHDHLAATFQGMSPTWSRAVCVMAGVDPELPSSRLEERDGEKLREAFVKSLELLKAGDPLTGENRPDFARRVAAEFTSRAEKLDLERKRSELGSLLDRRRKKLESLKTALNRDLGKAERAEEYKRKADLLLGNLFKIIPGKAWVEVDDWETGRTARLDLDPHVSPQIQVENLYQRYRKLKRTEEIASERLRMVQAEAEEVGSIAASLAIAVTLEEMHEIRDRLVLHGLLLPEKTAGARKAKEKAGGATSAPGARPGELVDISAYRYRSNDGFLILAGKGDRSNDALRRMSRPDDMWLHVRDIPGSHVYIVTRGREIPDTTLREAAMVAAWHSKARDGSNVPVDYTRAKYVTAIPGSGPGHVRFKRERTLKITPDQTRIEAMRLMAGDEER